MRTYRLRFYPSPRQKRLLAREFGAARFVYNWGLEQKSSAWREHRENLPIFALSRLVTRMKHHDRTWLQLTSSTVVTQSLRDLDRAFRNFFEKRAAYPRFKKRRTAQSIRYQLDPRQKTTYVPGQRLVLPLLGPLRLVWSRAPSARPKMVTVGRDSCNRYFVSLSVEEVVAPLPEAPREVGLDLGLRTAVTLSYGTKIRPPQYLRRHLRRLQHRSRVLSRREKGSARRRDARQRLARTHARVRDCRQDWLHKVTTQLIRENQAIFVEDLNLKGMLRNRCLSRALSDGALSELVRQLEYKAAWYGRTFVKVDRFFPSTKTCSVCGFVVEELSLSQTHWRCPECGTEHDRDVNAARNILAEGRRKLPPGGREVMRVEGVYPRPYAGRSKKRELHRREARS